MGMVMSDCFDHYMDAYEQDEAMGGCGFGFGLGRDYGPRSSQSNPRCCGCFSPNVFWRKEPNGKWRLYDSTTRKQHFCGLVDLDVPKVPYRRRA